MDRRKAYMTLSAFLVLSVLSFGIAFYGYGDGVSKESYMFMVSHSEYRSNEQGQVIGKLYDFRGDPIDVDNCTVTIYNPDKSIYLAPTLTDDTLEANDGTHYINFTTPEDEGVYEYKLECSFFLGGQQTRTISNSFHLNPALNTITTVNSSINLAKAYLDDINGTVTENNVYLVDVNGTVYDIRNTVLGINETMVQEFADIQINLSNMIVDLDYIRSNLFSDIDAYNNFTQIQDNLTQVFSELDDIDTNIGYVLDFCGNLQTSSSDLCTYVSSTNNLALTINDTLNNVIDVKLDAINQTTYNTWEYLSVNVTANFDSIFAELSGIYTGIIQINDTVNRIEDNVSTVIDNQEQQVYIAVFS